MPRTTGLAPLPDIGVLSYNGITFSSLYHSSISGAPTMARDGRTSTDNDWMITVDGIVTLEAGQTSTDVTWLAIRQRLESPGAQLKYDGKGFGPFVINPVQGGGLRDVAWGPKPKILEFTPAGGGRGAFIKWQCSTRIYESPFGVQGPLMQFNAEEDISYDDDGYTTRTFDGTMEIPLTWQLRAAGLNFAPSTSVDDYREKFIGQFASGIDLSRFRVTRRDFKVSRDQRIMEWHFEVQELPPMNLPPFATTAHGNFRVKNIKPHSFCQWSCSLSASYAIRKDRPRRWAWAAFLALLRFRMQQSELGVIPTTGDAANDQQPPPPNGPNLIGVLFGLDLLGPVKDRLFNQGNLLDMVGNLAKQAQAKLFKCLPISFEFNEGLYLDSKTMSFSAEWMLMTTIQQVFPASGVWRSEAPQGGFTWRRSMSDIEGWRSWLANRLDPDENVVVDLNFNPQ